MLHKLLDNCTCTRKIVLSMICSRSAFYFDLSLTYVLSGRGTDALCVVIYFYSGMYKKFGQTFAAL